MPSQAQQVQALNGERLEFEAPAQRALALVKLVQIVKLGFDLALILYFLYSTCSPKDY